VDFIEELAEASPITAGFRNLWKRATAVMSEDWNLRFAYMTQRDMYAMFNEAREGNPGFNISIPEYNQQRREFGFGESSMVIHIFFIFLNCNNIEQYHNVLYSIRLKRLFRESSSLVASPIHVFTKWLCYHILRAGFWRSSGRHPCVECTLLQSSYAALGSSHK
jgi:hypothetical protein